MIKDAYVQLLNQKNANQPPSQCLPSFNSSVNPTMSTSLNRSGFNLIGYATSPTGLGEDLRCFAELLEKLQIPFSIVDLPTDSSGKMVLSYTKLIKEQFATSIFFMSPMECQKNAERYPALFSTGSLKIGYFLWELPDFPDQYLPALKLVDQIWCPTKFVQAAFMSKSKQLTLTIPLPVIQAKPSGRDFRKELNIPENAFVGLFMFDVRSTLNRKNPQGVIEAFELFSEGKEDAFLILKINRWQGLDKNELSWLPNNPKIKVLTKVLEPSELADLYPSANYYLSLHRSEGFGRTLVEALQHGLWVVATDYSGPADYLNEKNSKIVNWLPQTVLKGDYPYNHFSMWADPIVSDAVTALESLYQEEEWRRSPGAAQSGQAYSVEALSQKYQGIIRAYTKPPN